MESTPGNTRANTLNDDKMTILYNAQDSHFDVDSYKISSSKDCLVETRRRRSNSRKALRQSQQATRWIA